MQQAMKGTSEMHLCTARVHEIVLAYRSNSVIQKGAGGRDSAALQPSSRATLYCTQIEIQADESRDSLRLSIEHLSRLAYSPHAPHQLHYLNVHSTPWQSDSLSCHMPQQPSASICRNAVAKPQCCTLYTRARGRMRLTARPMACAFTLDHIASFSFYNSWTRSC